MNQRLMSEAERASYCGDETPCSRCFPKLSGEECVLSRDCGESKQCVGNDALSDQEVDTLCGGESPCSLCAAETQDFCTTDGECGAGERCYRLHSTHAPLPAITYAALKREGDEFPRIGAPSLEEVSTLCEEKRSAISGVDDEQTPLDFCFLCLSPSELCEVSPQLCDSESP